MKRLATLACVVSMLTIAVWPVVLTAAGVQVADAKLGKGVTDRMITDEATSFAVGDKVYCWLKLTGGPSDPIKVDWRIGNEVDTIALTVGGDPWRTWSNKTVYKAGDWTVTVTDSAGAKLKEITFTVK